MTLRRICTFCVLACGFAAVACGERIPPEAPALSEQLGVEIQTIERSHIAAVRQVFVLKRNEVNRFFREVWLPAFASSYFQAPEIAEARRWVTQCQKLSAAELLSAETKAGRKINCDAEFLEFIVRSGPALLAALEENQAAILAPLDELERALVQRIEEKYTEVRAINNSLTTFLTSASEVVRARDRYLKKVGVTDEKIDQVVSDVSRIVDAYLEKAKGVDKGVTATGEFAAKAKKLMESLK